MRRAIAVVGLLAVIGAIVLVTRPFGPRGEPIDTAEVVRADLAVTVELAGTIAPRDSRSEGFGTAGTVATVLVEAGDRVTAGQVLATLDAQLLAAQAAAADAALTAAEARLAADMAGPTDAQVAAARDPVRQAEAALAAAKASRTEVVAQNDALVAAAEQALAAAQAQLAADVEAGADPAVIAADEAAVAAAQAALDGAHALRDAAVAQADASVVAASAALTSARNAYAVRVAPAPDALIAADEAALASAQASALAAHQTLALAELRAPIAGTVAAVDVRVGDRVGGGSALGGASGVGGASGIAGGGSALGGASGVGGASGIAGLGGSTTTTTGGTITIIDTTELRVDASASEIDMVSLVVGQPVAVTLDALPGLTLEATVCQLDTIGRSDSGVVAFPVEMCLASGAGAEAIRIGMSANVSIVLDSVSDALVIPAGSIRTADGRSYVQVVHDDGALERVWVRLGISNGTRTEILEGLEAGQRVALRPTDDAGD
jgi:macrolide-specific efflux system membrane fusion protein